MREPTSQETRLLSEAAIFSYLPPDHSVNGHVNRGIVFLCT